MPGLQVSSSPVKWGSQRHLGGRGAAPHCTPAGRRTPRPGTTRASVRSRWWRPGAGGHAPAGTRVAGGFGARVGAPQDALPPLRARPAAARPGRSSPEPACRVASTQATRSPPGLTPPGCVGGLFVGPLEPQRGHPREAWHPLPARPPSHPADLWGCRGARSRGCREGPRGRRQDGWRGWDPRGSPHPHPACVFWKPRKCRSPHITGRVLPQAGSHTVRGSGGPSHDTVPLTRPENESAHTTRSVVTASKAEDAPCALTPRSGRRWL